MLGASLFAADDEDSIIDGMADSIAALSLGVVYRHQSEDQVGDGHFLGIELSLTLGFELFSAINGAINEHERKKSL